MKVAALGRTHLLYDAIKAVSRRGHQIVLIGTCQSTPECDRRENDFADLAKELNCPYFCNNSINRPEYLKAIQESEAEVAISVNWYSLIKSEILNQFKHGIINAHAGDLPRFRGNACANWAILTGEDKVVLTLHQMVEQLDAGPILLQQALPLTGDTYIADVYNFFSAKLPDMFVEVLDGLASGSIHPREQPTDLALSLRCFPRLPQDNEIDWRHDAEFIGRMVRANAEPFSGAFTFLASERLTIWRARAGQLPYPYLGSPGQVAERLPATGEVVVLAGKGVLVLEEVELAGAGRAQATDVIKSLRARLGINTTQEIERLGSEVDRSQKSKDC